MFIADNYEKLNSLQFSIFGGFLKSRKKNIEKLIKERALKLSGAENVLAGIEDGYYETDLYGNFIYVNDFLSGIFGVSRTKLIGTKSFLYLKSLSIREIIKKYNKIYKTGIPEKSFEWDFIRNDGSKCYIEASASLVKDSQGKSIGFRGIVRDITGRKNAEKELKIQKVFAEALIDIAPEAIVILSNEDRVIKINKEFTKIFGYSAKEAQGCFVNDLIVPKSLKKEGLKLTQSAARGKRIEVETRRCHKDGSLVDVSLLASPVKIENMQIGVYAIYRDISVRKKIENALKESEERHRILLESAPDPIAVLDTENRVVYLNTAFARVFGWSIDDCIGMKIDFVSKTKESDFDEVLYQISCGEPFSGIETCRLTRQGEIVDVSISGACFYDTRKKPMGCILTFQDITEKKKTQKEIHYIAYHDSLTGLPNRKAFYSVIEKKIEHSRRRAGDGKWALLFLDLDRFKFVNDTLGHDGGDELLKIIAGLLQSCLRKTDCIYRVGGDEFTIILDNVNSQNDIAGVAVKLREKLARPFDIKGHEFYVSVSVGISLYPDNGRDVESLVKNADIAMYAAKEKGCGHSFFDEDMNVKALERMKLEGSLRKALDNNEFIIHYQPLVDNAKNILGMEALIRWEHPGMGLISPSDFIPLAEETGLITSIGKWVLYNACLQAKKLQESGFPDLYVAVNLSTVQFKDPRLVEIVENVLEKTGLSPASLKLEVTESGIMENPENAIGVMEALQEKGVSFSIDDFGTGYSSLSYLKRFPIDTLKIDRSFVNDFDRSSEDRELVKAIILMAKNLNMETVAEGVETEYQKDFLSCEGCGVMQGFYFGRPMPYDEFEKIMTKS